MLRGFQLAARFDLTLAPETAALCRSIAGSYRELPVERVWGEWEKWAVKAMRPSRGLQVLEETGWLAHFPEIAALRGKIEAAGYTGAVEVEIFSKDNWWKRPMQSRKRSW